MDIEKKIPLTMNEAIDYFLTSDMEDIESFKKYQESEALAVTHDGLGRWIRNTWLYPQDSPLFKHLADLGFLHHDDMSSTIILGIHRRLNGKSFTEEDIKSSVSYYEKYWASLSGRIGVARMKSPSKVLNNENNEKVE